MNRAVAAKRTRNEPLTRAEQNLRIYAKYAWSNENKEYEFFNGQRFPATAPKNRKSAEKVLKAEIARLQRDNPPFDLEGI